MHAKNENIIQLKSLFLSSSFSGQALFISVEQVSKQDSVAQREDKTIVLRSLHSVHML